MDREKPEWLESFIRSVFVRFKLLQTAPPLQTYVSLRWSANRFPGHQLVAMNGDQALIPVACRFGELYYSSYGASDPKEQQSRRTNGSQLSLTRPGRSQR